MLQEVVCSKSPFVGRMLFTNSCTIVTSCFLFHVFTARKGSRVLQSLTPEERSNILVKLADLLQTNKQQILSTNSLDMACAEASGESLLESRMFCKNFCVTHRVVEAFDVSTLHDS